jgi:two-component system, response regulator PdtaR
LEVEKNNSSWTLLFNIKKGMRASMSNLLSNLRMDIMTKARLMVVEDEYVIAEELKSHLENLGYVVSSLAASGEEAIQQAEAARPDLILMDICLQGAMDGIEAADQIHKHLDVPVIYLTANSGKEILNRARITEPFGYLLKPFREQELQACIEIALYKAKMEHERDHLLSELQQAQVKVKFLSGLIPICSYCKKIRNDQGYWEQLEVYIRDRSEADFSHGLCPDCVKKYFSDFVS